MPILKIGLDTKTHREFKVWCAENGFKMNRVIVGLINVAVTDGLGDGLKWSFKDCKPASAPSGRLEEGQGGE